MAPIGLIRVIKEKAQLSSPYPFAPKNCIEHAVRGWEVQCQARSDRGDLILLLLALKTADSCRTFGIQMTQRSAHVYAIYLVSRPRE